MLLYTDSDQVPNNNIYGYVPSGGDWVPHTHVPGVSLYDVGDSLHVACKTGFDTASGSHVWDGYWLYWEVYCVDGYTWQIRPDGYQPQCSVSEYYVHTHTAHAFHSSSSLNSISQSHIH